MEKIGKFMENWLMFLSHQEYFIEKGHAKKITPLPGKLTCALKRDHFKGKVVFQDLPSIIFGGARLVF